MVRTAQGIVVGPHIMPKTETKEQVNTYQPMVKKKYL